MTLTELKYIVAVAREKHFGRAADACFVAQPTLSVAVKKLEEELDVKIFERSSGEITLTPLGAEVVQQAQVVLEQSSLIHDIAKRGKDPLAGPLRLGIIYTIGPYLLPDLVRQNMALTPQMPLMLQENFTSRLLDMLRAGEIDCAIMAEPFPDSGLASAALYDEPFWAAVPSTHALAEQATIQAEALRQENMLLLGTGHCFRDHVLEVCPEFARFSSHAEGIRKSFEGSSLETIKHMVAAGMGVTLVPALSVPPEVVQQHGAASAANGADKPATALRGAASASQGKAGKLAGKPASRAAARAATTPSAASAASPHSDATFVRYLPFAGDVPTRRVVLVWRRSFTRYEAIAALRNCIYACALPGVQRLT